MLRLMNVSRPWTRRCTALALGLALLTAGCTGGSDRDEAASPEPPLLAEAAGRVVPQDPVIPENGTAPQAFLDRWRLPSCGSVAWTLNDPGPPDELWRCLAESQEAGQAAELIVQAPGSDSTSVSYYRVLEGQELVEVWHRDTMGDRWWRGTCSSLDAVDGVGPCEATERFDHDGG